MPQRSAASEAAPWVVALGLVLAALVAYRGCTSTARVPEGARAVSAEPERPRAAAAPTASPAPHADADVPPAPIPVNDADVVELRRRSCRSLSRRWPRRCSFRPSIRRAASAHGARHPRAAGTAVIAVEDGRIAKLFTSARRSRSCSIRRAIRLLRAPRSIRGSTARRTRSSAVR